MDLLIDDQVDRMAFDAIRRSPSTGDVQAREQAV